MQQFTLIQLNIEQLENFLEGTIQKHFLKFESHFQPKMAKDLMTRQEVADYFQINLSTLHNWCKKGKLNPLGLGSRVYFHRDEVENAIVRLNQKKG